MPRAAADAALAIKAHTIHKRTLTLYIYAPTPGKLTATAKGLTKTSRTYTGQEAQTITLTQKKAGKLNTTIKLTYTPTHGKKQTKTLKIQLKK